MASKNQPERWEATWLAGTMAVAGALFLFDKVGSLMQTSLLSIPAVTHSAPVLLAAVGAVLLLAEQGGESGRRERDGGRHEL